MDLDIEYLILNYVIQGAGLLSALRAVSAANPVASIFWLIGTFLCVSCCFIYLGAEFLGLVFLVVYVGAIAVLFLFVVMMLNVRRAEPSSLLLTYFPAALLAVWVLVVLLSGLVYPAFSPFPSHLYGGSWLDKLNSRNNIEVLGQVLYTYFFPLFLIASLILLVAMIGSIVLTLQQRGDVRRQLVSQQLSHHVDSQLDLQCPR